MSNMYDTCSCGNKKKKVSPRCRKCWLGDKESLRKHGKESGFKEGYIPWNKGSSGLTIWKPERREKIMRWFKENGGGYKGKKDSPETRRKKSESEKGPKHWNWKGGITPQNTIRRHSLEHKQWREEVFKRDDYTCQVCLERGIRIEANHIYPWRTNKDLQFQVSNGITLCVPHHRLIHLKEERVVEFFKALLIMGPSQNRVNSGNLLEEMKTLLGKS